MNTTDALKINFYGNKICQITVEDTRWTILKPTSAEWKDFIQITNEDAYGTFFTEKIKVDAFKGLYKSAPFNNALDGIVEFLKK